jgi:phosphate transport system substrate-binding protein
MTKTTLQFGTLFCAGLFAVTADPADAQLKPIVDPNIQSYVKVQGVSGTLTIAGSETMKGLSLRWESNLKEVYPGLTVQVKGIGSETGPPALIDGTAQVAAMSRRMTRKEVEAFSARYGYEPTEVPVAVDALAVFAHRDNPLTGVTLQQLEGMFCKERRGMAKPITSWAHLGLFDEWSESKITLIGRNAASGTAAFFLEHVCANGEFRDTVKKEPGSASVIVAIKSNRYAVGFSGIGYRTSFVRPLPLSIEKGQPYVEPTFENAVSGSYPLRRHLYLYINKAPKTAAPTAVIEFVKFVLSQEGQQAVVKEGFFPLPTAELTKQVAAWKEPLRAASRQSNP